MVLGDFIIKNKLKIVIAVFAIAMIVWGIFINAICTEQQTDKRKMARLNALNRGLSIDRDVEECYSVLSALDIMLADGDGWQIKDFDNTAARLMKFHPYIASLQLAPAGRVTQIYPLAGNEAGLIDLINDEKRGPIARYTRDSGKTTMQGPFDLKQGGQGIALRHPIYREDAAGNKSFWGFAIAIIKVPMAFNSTVETFNSFGYAYVLYNYDHLNEKWRLVLTSGDIMQDAEVVKFDVFDTKWQLEVMPVGGWYNLQEIMPYAVCGMLLVLLFTAMSYMLLRLAEDKRAFANMSLKDELTKLENKRSFDQRLSYLLQHCNNFGIYYIDVNFFKEINDAHGHVVGDALLRNVARIIQGNVSYPVYRIGGDEFVILIDDDIGEAGYQDIAQKINKAFEAGIKCSSKLLYITVSLGFARYPDDSENLHRLIEIADQRMYADKEMKHKQGNGKG